MPSESSSTSPQQEPTELERTPQPLNESRSAITRYPSRDATLPTTRAVDHKYGGGRVGVGYQQDEEMAIAASATNEITALIALQFHLKHLKLMIPFGGPNLAPHPRWTPAIGMRGVNSGVGSFFLCPLGTGGRKG